MDDVVVPRERVRERVRERDVSQSRELVVWCKDAT